MKTSVIILAAGQGKRMGTVKQLLPWGDTTVLGQSITCYNDINIDKLIIVVGYKADLIKEIFSHYKITWAYNEDFAGDMASSFKKGFEKIDNDTEVLYLALGDTPAIKAETLQLMESVYDKNRYKIIIPMVNGRKGHPVLFSKDIFKDLEMVGRNYNLKDVIKNHDDEVYYLQVEDENIIYDIDTIEEYETLLRKNNL